MVVNKNKLWFFLLNISLLFSVSATADNQAVQNEILQTIQKNVTESTVKLGKQIKFCEKQKKLSESPILNTSFLKNLNAKNTDVIIALSHMNIRNSFKCEEKERVDLAYHLGVLASVKRHYNFNITEINEIEDNLIYPSIKEFGTSIKYSKLSDELKQYIHKIVGNKPFDLIKSLTANHLINF